MFNALASLAQRHGKRTVIFAAIFFVVAGAIGGGVASKLAPYGADDPATESVKAADRLEADGSVTPVVAGGTLIGVAFGPNGTLVVASNETAYRFD